MNIRVVSFSLKGGETAKKLTEGLEKLGHSCRRFAPEKYSGATGAAPLDAPISKWAGEGFLEADAIVFVGAVGIAVRACAPHIKSKKTDPAVVVADELGKYAIPVLSGHIGGANELALAISRILGAEAVITTATDINGVFAVDVFARKNHLKISDMTIAKEISARLLSGKKVGFQSDVKVLGALPKGLTEEKAETGILISRDTSKKPFERTLVLMPQPYTVGIGCKKDKPVEDLDGFFRKCLAESGITPDEIRCIASIDVKKDEAGLTALCEKYKLPFKTYTAEALESLEGEFSESAFVKSTVGVGCVCERAAVMSGGSKLIKRKTAENGMTLAIGKNEEDICFE